MHTFIVFFYICMNVANQLATSYFFFFYSAFSAQKQSPSRRRDCHDNQFFSLPCDLWGLPYITVMEEIIAFLNGRFENCLASVEPL